METKLTVREMEPIKAKLGFQGMLAVSSDGRKGVLAMLWKTKVVLTRILTSLITLTHGSSLP